MKEFNEAEIKKDLKIDAHALGIPIGAAEIFINRLDAETDEEDDEEE